MIPNLAQIEITKITPSDSNPRKKYDTGRFEDLKQSIKDKGVLQPVIVRPLSGKADEYELVCGWRRFLASKDLGLETIPGLVCALSDKEALEIQVIENLQREEVHPLEEARGYSRLISEYGYGGVEEVAARIGKSTSYVYQRLKLCDLTDNVRSLFEEGKMSLSAALAVAKIPDEKQEKVAAHVSGLDEYEDRPMTEKQVRDYMAKYVMLSIDKAPFDANVVDLVEGRGSCFECQKMSGYNIDLFPEMCEENLCSDAACYRAKQRAWYLQAIKPCREEGYKVVEPDDFEDIFESWQYKCFTEICHQHPEDLTYGELLSDLPHDRVFAGVDDQGLVVFAVDNKTAERALEAALEEAGDGQDAADEEDEEEDLEDVRQRHRREAFYAVSMRIIPQIGELVKKASLEVNHPPPLRGDFLNAFIKSLCEVGTLNSFDDYKEAHPEIEIQASTEEEAADEDQEIAQLVAVLDYGELCAFLVEMYLFSGRCYSIDDNFKQAYAAYGVNIEAEIDAEIDRMIGSRLDSQNGG